MHFVYRHYSKITTLLIIPSFRFPSSKLHQHESILYHSHIPHGWMSEVHFQHSHRSTNTGCIFTRCRLTGEVRDLPRLYIPQADGSFQPSPQPAILTETLWIARGAVHPSSGQPTFSHYKHTVLKQPQMRFTISTIIVDICLRMIPISIREHPCREPSHHFVVRSVASRRFVCGCNGSVRNVLQAIRSAVTSVLTTTPTNGYI